MRKILNFGSCNIDYVYELDHIVSPGETEATKTLPVSPLHKSNQNQGWC